ncbi:unnamed protein product [Angiostrongylus costaricensis]|uniref:DUF1758 domain-containing protein n=1 Tax=Angiostrongylus costaricensis TaxID=334426 RepID=A0A0R3PWX1_ANGCS|nr:unnamed protein product [Angiostrongylus costaricensis]
MLRDEKLEMRLFNILIGTDFIRTGWEFQHFRDVPRMSVFDRQPQCTTTSSSYGDDLHDFLAVTGLGKFSSVVKLHEDERQTLLIPVQTIR